MKKLYAVFLVIIPGLCQAQSQGPYSPTFALSVPSSPGATWSNPTNVYVSDNNTASAILTAFPSCSGANCYFTVGLAASSFNFSVPVAATINGIVAEVQRRTINLPVTLMDSTVKLLKAGVPVGTNHAGSVAWTVSLTYITYGSASDLWGATWTPADINNSNFGLYFTVRNTTTSPNGAPQVDHMRITVYYTLSTGMYSQTLTTGDLFNLSNSEGLLDVACNEAGSVTMMNLMGQPVFSQKVNADEKIQISTSGLAKGVYFIKLAADSRGQTKKVFIQ